MSTREVAEARQLGTTGKRSLRSGNDAGSPRTDLPGQRLRHGVRGLPKRNDMHTRVRFERKQVIAYAQCTTVVLDMTSERRLDARVLESILEDVTGDLSWIGKMDHLDESSDDHQVCSVAPS